MYRLQNLPFYDFSLQNKYASNYNVAYKRALQTQNEIIKKENSSYGSVSEVEKLKEDLKRWEKKTEDYSILAKAEENKIKEEKQTGSKINFLA